MREGARHGPAFVILLAAGVAVLGSARKDGGECDNDFPLIGVLSQPGEPAPEGYSYIAASYIKFIETGGARAVPIPFDLPPDELERRFNAINGLVIPGGSQALSPHHQFYDTSARLFRMALEANDRGTYWPVWGTCLGFEALAVIISSNHSVLGGFDAEDLPSSLIFAPGAERSAWFQGMPPSATHQLQHLPVAMENHQAGLGDTALAANPALSAFINVVAYSEDREGRLYVSVFEAKDYPVWGVQWHPEKNVYEHAMHLHIPHSPEAVEVTQAVANFLVRQARRNCHRPADVEELDRLLIYNWAPVFTGVRRRKGEEVDFDQCYFFPEAREFMARATEA